LLSMPAHEAQSASAQGERPTTASAQAAAAGERNGAADDAMSPKQTKTVTASSPDPADLKSN